MNLILDCMKVLSKYLMSKEKSSKHMQVVSCRLKMRMVVNNERVVNENRAPI